MIQAFKNNIWTVVKTFDTPADESALMKELTFKVPQYWFYRSFRNRAWDGSYSFFNRPGRKFPTGLITVLSDELRSKISLIEYRKKPSFTRAPVELNGIELRDYQQKVIEDAIQAERCVINSPVNSGKTEIAAGIIKSLKDCRVLWLTHRGSLMVQTKERLELRLGEEVGIVHGDTFDIKRVTVGMVPTMYFRLKSKDNEMASLFHNWLGKEVDMLVIDECHHQSGWSWRHVAQACNAYYRIGLSATPCLRTEIQNLWLIGLTGEVIKTVSNAELIERDISARPRIVRIKNEIAKTYQPSNYRLAYAEGIEKNESRNAQIAGIIRLHVMKNEPVICMCTTIKHAQDIMARVKGKAVFLTGFQGLDYRIVQTKKFEKGKIKAIVCTPLWDEGVDLPFVQALILAAAGKSHLKLLQRVGRGMRKKPTGENVVTIYDWEDKGDKYLEGHSLHRLKLYRQEGFEVIPTSVNFS